MNKIKMYIKVKKDTDLKYIIYNQAINDKKHIENLRINPYTDLTLACEYSRGTSMGS